MNGLAKKTATLVASAALALTLNACSSDDGGSNSSGGDPSSPGGSGSGDGVTIGTQVWMKKNLDVAGGKCYGEDGQVRTLASRDENEDPIYEYTDLTSAEIQANCTKYGRLYDWETAQTVCSGGWHLPDSTEWDILKNFIENDNGCTSCAGKHLKAASGWSGGSNGLDSYGFNALPGGLGGYIDVDNNIGYQYIGDRGYWWTATDHNNATNGHGRNLRDGDHLDKGNGSKTGLRSIRCIKD